MQGNGHFTDQAGRQGLVHEGSIGHRLVAEHVQVDTGDAQEGRRERVRVHELRGVDPIHHHRINARIEQVRLEVHEPVILLWPPERLDAGLRQPEGSAVIFQDDPGYLQIVQRRQPGMNAQHPSCRGTEPQFERLVRGPPAP